MQAVERTRIATSKLFISSINSLFKEGCRARAMLVEGIQLSTHLVWEKV